MPGGLVRHCGAALGALYHPVVVKACLRLEEPIQWRGGCYWDIWKGAADPSIPVHSRSVMVSPHL
eukprot:749896-Pyramimonas_sp.AAC.1